MECSDSIPQFPDILTVVLHDKMHLSHIQIEADCLNTSLVGSVPPVYVVLLVLVCRCPNTGSDSRLGQRWLAINSKDHLVGTCSKEVGCYETFPNLIVIVLQLLVVFELIQLEPIPFIPSESVADLR